LQLVPGSAGQARDFLQSWRRIFRRGIAPSDRLGRHRYVVERSLAWLVGYRRLQVRYERRGDILLGFLHLACALICLKSLSQPAEGLS
jgi:transposase